MTQAEEIVDSIIRDLTDRSGFDGMWDSLDDDIRQEIRSKWIQLASAVLSPLGAAGVIGDIWVSTGATYAGCLNCEYALKNPGGGQCEEHGFERKRW